MEEKIQSTVNNPITEKPITNSDQLRPTSTKKTNSGFLITLFSILLLVAVGVAGFFAYQTQKLVGELRSMNSELNTPAPEVSPTPTPTPDLTADWEIYTNDEYGFQVKYPADFQALVDQNDLYGWPNAIVLFYGGGQSYDLPIEVWNKKEDYEEKYPDQSILTVFETEDGSFITLSNPNDTNDVKQIISTFEFVENEAETACTLEAKQCPDGSYVGRSGPNCEFALCPTESPSN